jgi:hypothetical protein
MLLKKAVVAETDQWIRTSGVFQLALRERSN